MCCHFHLDPYVKVYLIHESRRIDKWKSCVKKNTLIPVFNESVQFSLTSYDFNSLSLDVLLMEYDRFTHDSVVGVVNIGAGSRSEVGRSHWEEAMSSADQPISRYVRVSQAA